MNASPENFISDGLISPPASFKHSGQYTHVEISIIVYQHLSLPIMKPVKTPGVLRQRPPPGYREGQEQSIEPSIIKALTKIPTRGDEKPLLFVWALKNPEGFWPL
jgi:hypothetical protein